LHRELRELGSFDTVFNVKILPADCRLEYDHDRPPLSLRYQTPAEFARHWRAEH
jgi:hypothetical protein